MRKVCKAALVLGTAAAIGAYMGFPTRVGLTKSQARVSMPGDLLLPTATMQADRATTLPATPGNAWAVTADLKDVYEDLYDVPLDMVYEEAPDLVVWQTSSPIKENQKDMLAASVAVTMTPLGNDSLIHVRERYLPLDDKKGKLAAAIEMITSAAIVTSVLAKNRRFLKQAPAIDLEQN